MTDSDDGLRYRVETDHPDATDDELRSLLRAAAIAATIKREAEGERLTDFDGPIGWRAC
jgi:hypothetical protein